MSWGDALGRELTLAEQLLIQEIAALPQSANQVLGKNAANTAHEYKTVAAGNHVTVTHSVRNIEVKTTDNDIRTLSVPASAMWARQSAGCAALATTELTTNKQNLKTLDFDPATQEHSQFGITMPDNWDGGDITFKAIWLAASGSGDVIWGLQAIAYNDGDTLDDAFGTAGEVTDTLATANTERETAESAAITIGGTPVAGDYVMFQLYRKAADAGDTLAVDAKLKAIRIQYGISTYSH